MASAEFWYEFASTYSYPAALRVGALAEARGVSLAWRPFLLGPIFAAQGWRDSPFNIYPAKGRYMWRDLERTCEAMGVPLKRPEPFPQPSLLAARVALALEGEERADFSRRVLRRRIRPGRADRRSGHARVLARTHAASIRRRRWSGPKATPTRRCSRPSAPGRRRSASSARRASSPADGEVFWGNDRLEQGLDWAARAASEARRTVAGRLATKRGVTWPSI